MVLESIRHNGCSGGERRDAQCSCKGCSCRETCQVDHYHRCHYSGKLLARPANRRETINMFRAFPSILFIVFLSIRLFIKHASSSETRFEKLVVRGDNSMMFGERNDDELQFESGLGSFSKHLGHFNESLDAKANESFYNLFTNRQDRFRKLYFNETIFSRKALNKQMLENKFNISYQGELKNNPEISLVILYNDTTIFITQCANKYYYWEFGQTAGAAVIFIMIVVGNLSILHRLKSCRRRRSNVNYFIVQLAIADLCVGFFNVTLDCILRLQKVFAYGQFACLASKYISVLFIYSSTYLLVALSIDRWEAVVKPLAFTRNRNRGCYLVLAAWGLACFLAIPATINTGVKEVWGLPQCYTHFDQLGWQIYMIYVLCTIVVIPVILIMVCYIQIVYTIWTKGRKVARQQQERVRKREVAQGEIGGGSKTSPKITETTVVANEVASFATAVRRIDDNGTTLCRGTIKRQVSSTGYSTSSSSVHSSASIRPAGEADGGLNVYVEQQPSSVGPYYERPQRQSDVMLDGRMEEDNEISQECTEDESVSTDEDADYENLEYGIVCSGDNNKLEMYQIEQDLCEQQQYERHGNNLQQTDKVVGDRKLQAGVGKFELKEPAAGATNQPTKKSQAARGSQRHPTARKRPNRAMKRGPSQECGTGGAQQHGSGVIPKARIKTIKMTFVIVLAFILCWSPFCIINLCAVFGLMEEDTYYSNALMTLSQSLAHLNSAVNPIIFWLFSSKRNNQRGAQVTAASSDTRLTGRGGGGGGGPLSKGLAAIGEYARKATRSSSSQK